jgi:hypothetical protein
MEASSFMIAARPWTLEEIYGVAGVMRNTFEGSV